MSWVSIHISLLQGHRRPWVQTMPSKGLVHLIACCVVVLYSLQDLRHVIELWDRTEGAIWLLLMLFPDECYLGGHTGASPFKIGDGSELVPNDIRIQAGEGFFEVLIKAFILT